MSNAGPAGDGTDDESTDPEVDSQPADSMRRRAGESDWKLWLLMDADRWVVAGGLLAGVFVAMVALGAADPSPLQQSVASSDPTETLFQAYVTAIVTGVTLVVTLNQLVLSQELGPVGDQRDRMEGAMGFREDAADLLDEPVSPADPASFLRELIDQACARAADVRDAVDESGDEELAAAVDRYVESVTENADRIGDDLADAEFGSYDLLSAVLDFNYSWKIYAARRLHHAHADALSEEADAAFEDLERALGFFGPAREHFKTLYFQWELVDLSREMLYAAVPALVAASAMVVYYDARAVPGATLGISNDVLVVGFGVTVATVPFALLVAYVLRIATVAKHTLAIGPFVLRNTDRGDEFD